jgi:hypothetical protein
MADFEAHEGKMTSEPSGQPFASRHSAKAALGNGSLPPGQAEMANGKKRTPSKTKRGYIKKVGD